MTGRDKSVTVTPLVMTVDEVAEALRCSRSYVYVLHQREGLPFTRLGGRTVVRASQLDAWLDERTERAS